MAKSVFKTIMNPQCDCGIGDYFQRLGEVYREVESAGHDASSLIRPRGRPLLHMMMSDLSWHSCGVAVDGAWVS